MNLATKKGDFEPIEISEGKSLNLGKVCSTTEHNVFIDLWNKYNDVVSWTYEDLKGFDLSLSQHTIELDPATKTLRQKQRPINPTIEPLMKKELVKLIEARLILTIKCSSWVVILVPIKKRMGK